MKRIVLVIFGLFISPWVLAQRKDYLVTLKTKFGTMHLVLFDETPLHKANFIQHVQQKYYDGLLFHRVIDGFMIQGGDPLSRNAPAGQRLGSGGDSLRIPFEFTPKHIHKKGALAAARDNNPAKKSSSCQFYIVQGKTLTDKELEAVKARNKMNYTPEQQAIYKTIGGTPRLDNNYTVFGQVIDNEAVIDSIAKQARDAYDRPLKDISMEIQVKKMRKKKITRKYHYQFE